MIDIKYKKEFPVKLICISTFYRCVTLPSRKIVVRIAFSIQPYKCLQHSSRIYRFPIKWSTYLQIKHGFLIDVEKHNLYRNVSNIITWVSRILLIKYCYFFNIDIYISRQFRNISWLRSTYSRFKKCICWNLKQ